MSYRLRFVVNVDWVSHGTGVESNVLGTVQFLPTAPVVITGGNDLTAANLLSALVNTALDIYAQASARKTLERMQQFARGGQ